MRSWCRALLLAVLVASLANAVPATAEGVTVCYWTTHTDQKTKVINPKLSFFSKVWYQIGHGCAGEPLKLYVSEYKNQVTFTDTPSWNGHVDNETALLRWVNTPADDFWTWQNPPA